MLNENLLPQPLHKYLCISYCLFRLKLEERFRKTIADYKGLRKGNISEALEEAIDLWIKAHTIKK